MHKLAVLLTICISLLIYPLSSTATNTPPIISSGGENMLTFSADRADVEATGILLDDRGLGFAKCWSADNSCSVLGTAINLCASGKCASGIGVAQNNNNWIYTSNWSFDIPCSQISSEWTTLSCVYHPIPVTRMFKIDLPDGKYNFQYQLCGFNDYYSTYMGTCAPPQYRDLYVTSNIISLEPGVTKCEFPPSFEETIGTTNAGTNAVKTITITGQCTSETSGTVTLSGHPTDADGWVVYQDQTVTLRGSLGATGQPGISSDEINGMDPTATVTIEIVTEGRESTGGAYNAVFILTWETD
jgi:hypothetical protein